ncbi:Zn-dependent protease [Pontibacter sp. HJ8]
MKNALYILTFFLIVTHFSAQAQVYKKDEPLAHTYSIVARDAKTGEMAVGVQSHWFSVGTAVPWVEAGVGVVATQSFVNKSFGLRGLELLKAGKSPQEALDILLADDEGREVRQVSIMDVQGRVATHTGKQCIRYAGHTIGKDFSVQANMMLTDKVWPAMAKAFETSAGKPLAERVLIAMQAAEREGGDIRGKQSAVLMVVRGKATDAPWDDKTIDLRVDDHEKPLDELARLLKVYRAYEHMNNGDLAVEKGEMEKAMEEYGKAETMFPDNLEMKYWHAITLANNGDVNGAIKLLKEVYKKDKNWKELTDRLPEVGLLTLSPQDLQKVLKVQ